MSTLRSFQDHDGYQRWLTWTEWPLVALGLLFLVVLILPLAEPPPATLTERRASRAQGSG